MTSAFALCVLGFDPGFGWPAVSLWRGRDLKCALRCQMFMSILVPSEWCLECCLHFKKKTFFMEKCGDSGVKVTDLRQMVSVIMLQVDGGLPNNSTSSYLKRNCMNEGLECLDFSCADVMVCFSVCRAIQ